MGGHHHHHDSIRVLRISLVLTFFYIVLLIVIGIRAHSLALLSEAGHNVSDFLALLLSLAALYIQRRPPSSTKTFGYDRAGVLAAFLNALTLVGVAFYIFVEAAKRLSAPVSVHATEMIWVGAAGVLLNGVIAALLFSESKGDLNIRSAFLHMFGDTLSTAAVIAGAWVILRTGQSWIDPALSFGIGALILWSSFGIVRETLNILLEGTPRGVDYHLVSQAILDIKGVNDVHDLHIWSIGSQTTALACHIAIEDIPPSESEAILREAQKRLREKFHISHTTIQFEHVECDIAHGCVMPVTDTQHHGHAH
ncbi:MAG TPA: cation diffusion facilitator family transporter [Terriglobales bacterium]|jgi:cobalt-zinc-cadmium efflux system protein|nr:cation diffusion facilitator family transporter [Terriglobales bacterium]